MANVGVLHRDVIRRKAPRIFPRCFSWHGVRDSEPNVLGIAWWCLWCVAPRTEHERHFVPLCGVLHHYTKTTKEATAKMQLPLLWHGVRDSRTQTLANVLC